MGRRVILIRVGGDFKLLAQANSKQLRNLCRTQCAKQNRRQKCRKLCNVRQGPGRYPIGMMKPSTEHDYRRRIARVVEAILLEPGAPHTLESLAALAHLSPYHFHRIYRALTGESVVETVQRLRLAQAAQRLTDASAQVTAVAHDAGYNSPQAFARAFRGFTGVSPSEFRARQRHLAGGVADRRTRSGGAGHDASHANAASEASANESGTSADESPSIELAEIAPVDVLCVRHDGPVGTIGQTFRRLIHLVCSEQSASTDQRIGICTRAAGVNGGFEYHAGVVASPAAVSVDGVTSMRLDGGLYAVHRLVGPYALIAPTFRALYGGWLPHSGYTRDRRPALEWYRNPLIDGAQHTCVTDLMIPLCKD
ncbi:AraC family transcriptional regulator [Paraburkholderia fungorum]|uniref:AraC family transcriptional regulator n=2 Tax=Paraburkholderia fungorum TaxID=134537 RepID=A0A1H1I1E5_9BURK|nr:AraC family transcriptional regulator [Paraburkholderia fungorum]